jgi:uncharacterized coiled-coil protein SlyX
MMDNQEDIINELDDKLTEAKDCIRELESDNDALRDKIARLEGKLDKSKTSRVTDADV